MSSSSGTQTSPVAVSNGAGDILLAWQDQRDDTGDIYAQRITPAGERAPGWPAGGLPVCTAASTQLSPAIAADGAGGAFIAWQDDRAGIPPDLYVQHVLATGRVDPSWPADGAPLCLASGAQRAPVLARDGAGGCFAMWLDSRAGRFNPDVYLVHLAAGGALAAGWPVDGMIVSSFGSAPLGYPDRLVLLPDGTGGVFATWPDGSGLGMDLLAQRFSSSGARTWASSDVDVTPVSGFQFAPVADYDGAGGMILAWQDGRPQADCSPTCVYDVYAERLTGAGALAPGWPALNLDLAVCTAAGTQDQPAAASDGAGGLFVAWRDGRSGTHVYLERVGAAGSLSAGWPAASAGLLLSGTAGAQRQPAVAADGAGGAVIVWADTRGADADIYASRIDASGGLVAGWTINGTPVCTAAGIQTAPVVVGDGTGGLIAAWEDYRSGTSVAIYVERVGANGVAPPTAGVAPPPAAGPSLGAPHPDPARGPVSLALTLPEAGEVRVDVLDVAGRPVRRLMRGPLAAGTHHLTWDGRDARGRPVADGVYFLFARSAAGSASRRVVRVR